MALYQMLDDHFTKVDNKTFSELRKKERPHLQQLLKKQIEILSLDILIIDEEYGSWEGSQRRIDLLGIDKMGSLVVIELKRDDKNSYMDLQAFRYAAMISNLEIEQVIEIYKKFCEKENIQEDSLQTLASHLNCEQDELQEKTVPNEVKIVLVNEDFSDRELTSTVLWLSDNYGLDITCIRLVPYQHNNDVLVDVQQVIPLKEAKDFLIQKRKKREKEKSNKKDFSEYLFEGEKYNKRRLVLAVFQQLVKDKSIKSIQELEVFFPAKQGRHLFYSEFKSIEDARLKRFFTKEGELIKFTDTTIAVSNGWGKDNLDVFLDYAKKIYTIEKI